MKQTYFLLFFFVIVDMSGALGQTKDGVSHGKYGIYETDGIKPEEYRWRRSMILAKMESNSIAILRANEYARRSGDEN